MQHAVRLGPCMQALQQCPACRYIFRRMEGPARHGAEDKRRPLENGAAHAAAQAPAKRPAGGPAASSVPAAAPAHSAAEIKALQSFRKANEVKPGL